MIEDILQQYVDASVQHQWTPSWPLPKNIYEDKSWPWFPITFDADFKAMHKECVDNDHLFVGHRQQDRHLSYNHEGWAAITLHGIAPDKTEHWPQYGFNSMEEANLHWTEACETFPLCAAFIKSLRYGVHDRVRIMKLKAGGYIMPHVDGPGRIFGPLNIAINNPDGCGFYFKDWGRVPFVQGNGFFLDIANEHIVWNNSNEDRYHFIVHGWDNNWIKDIAATQFKEIYEPK